MCTANNGYAWGPIKALKPSITATKSYYNPFSGVDPKYDCENYGDQGITPGCKDIYYANIDCQWLDVTELDLGTYIFKMAINPEYKVTSSPLYNVHYGVLFPELCKLIRSPVSLLIQACIRASQPSWCSKIQLTMKLPHYMGKEISSVHHSLFQRSLWYIFSEAICLVLP